MAVAIRDRGPIGRGLKRAFGAASAESWFETAIYFHRELRHRRFTEEHQQRAGFAQRKGQGMAKGSKAYRRSYTGRKESMKGHTRALEFSGATRRAMAAASVRSTRRGGFASYPGGRTFSFRHPKSRIRMWDEFRRLLPEEVTELAEYYDAELDKRWKPE